MLYFLEKTLQFTVTVIFSREDSYSVRWFDELCYIFQRRPLQYTVTWWTLLYFPEKTPTVYGDLMNFVIFSRVDSYCVWWLDELCYIFQRKLLQCTVTWWTWTMISLPELIVYVDGEIELPHDKTNKMTVHPAKTQISLGILPVWLSLHCMLNA